MILKTFSNKKIHFLNFDPGTKPGVPNLGTIVILIRSSNKKIYVLNFDLIRDQT